MNSIVNTQLLSFVVAYKVHCWILLNEHERNMTIPKQDLCMSQMSRIFNNPDLQSFIVECWPAATKNTSQEVEKKVLKLEGPRIVSDKRVQILIQFITDIYSVLHERWMEFNFEHPTRSTPYNLMSYKIRRSQIVGLLMNAEEHVKFRTSLKKDFEEGDQLRAIKYADLEEQMLMPCLDDYEPFDVREVFGGDDDYKFGIEDKLRSQEKNAMEL